MAREAGNEKSTHRLENGEVQSDALFARSPWTSKEGFAEGSAIANPRAAFIVLSRRLLTVLTVWPCALDCGFSQAANTQK